jgi:hypothetical protein
MMAARMAGSARRGVQPFTVSSSTGTSNLRTIANSLGYTGAGDCILHVTSGVDLFAGVVPGTWPSGVTITLDLQSGAFASGVPGKGGNGTGSPSGGTGLPGNAGGPAIDASAVSGFTFKVTGGGTARGGGGGGGGGGYAQSLDPVSGFVAGGGAGGDGQGHDTGSPPTGGGGSGTGSSGGNGSLASSSGPTSGATGGTDGAGANGGTGGNGGAFGAAGTSGGTGTGGPDVATAGGPGGSAGLAVNGLANLAGGVGTLTLVGGTA